MDIEEQRENEEFSWDMILDVPQEQFHVKDEQSLEWWLGKIAELNDSIERVKLRAAIMCEQLTRRKERLENRFMPDVQHLLEETVQASGGKIKTLYTLNGKATLRHTQASLRVADTHAAMEWAKLNYPSCLNLIPERYELDVVRFKLAAKNVLDSPIVNPKTGEVLDGGLLPGMEEVPSKDSVILSFK